MEPELSSTMPNICEFHNSENGRCLTELKGEGSFCDVSIENLWLEKNEKTRLNVLLKLLNCSESKKIRTVGKRYLALLLTIRYVCSNQKKIASLKNVESMPLISHSVVKFWSRNSFDESFHFVFARLRSDRFSPQNFLKSSQQKNERNRCCSFKMILPCLFRSFIWPMNFFGSDSKDPPNPASENQKTSDVNENNQLLETLQNLKPNFEVNTNNAQSLTHLPSPKVLSALGKYYLTREDLEKLIEKRFAEETPRERVEMLLWRDEMNNYPVFARVKDYQCSIVSMGVGVAYGFTRKEEMKPVYIRQTSMAKFQDRLTAERAFRQYNVVIFMKEAYKVGLIGFMITETILTTQYAIQAYRNKSTIYDAIPGGALVGFAMKALHSPLATVVGIVQGAALGFIYGFCHHVGTRLVDYTYENIHYEQVMQSILERENAELWSSNLDDLPKDYKAPEKEKTWGLGWFKS